MPSRKKPTAPTWTRMTPATEGFYWYLHDSRDFEVLRVFKPLGSRVFMTWDWDNGRFMLCAVEKYRGQWWGPMEVTK
jgi:hypothetical protein